MDIARPGHARTFDARPSIARPFNARIAIAVLAPLGGGIALGLAAHPQLRTFPEQDWRERYRQVSAPADPAPQPGVSYYGDGSTAWVFGGLPHRYADDLPVRIPILREDYAAWNPPPIPEPAEYRGDDGSSDGIGEAERAAAQAIVADALARSAPADNRAQTGARPEATPGTEPGRAPDPAVSPPVAATVSQPPGDDHSPAQTGSSGPPATL